MNDLAVLETDALPLHAKALAMAEIQGQASLEWAAELRSTAKARLKQSADFFKVVTEKTWAAHKSALAQQKTVEQPYYDIIAHLDPMIGAYMAAQESARKVAEAALTAQATQQAEATQVAVAAHLEAAGQRAEAEMVMAQPIAVAPVSLPKVRADGVNTRTDWDFTIVNIDVVPREFMVVDFVKVRQVVKALKGATSIPGIKAFSKQTVVGGGRT